jgi:hypothetical protein
VVRETSGVQTWGDEELAEEYKAVQEQASTSEMWGREVGGNELCSVDVRCSNDSRIYVCVCVCREDCNTCVCVCVGKTAIRVCVCV